MPFSPKVQEDALVACGRFCCICHRFAGTKIEIHHIIQKADGGSDDFDNAIPLCLECHADMGKTDAHHPGRKAYPLSELKRHRENWYKRVADNTPVLPDEDAEEFRKRYKELRNEANYVLTFYANWSVLSYLFIMSFLIFGKQLKVWLIRHITDYISTVYPILEGWYETYTVRVEDLVEQYGIKP